MPLRRISSAIALTVVVFLLGCDEERCVCPGPWLPYDQTSPANVLKKLQQTYQRQDPVGYAEILADDFRFYFHPATREEYDLPEFWTRLEDSTCTSRLFASDEI